MVNGEEADIQSVMHHINTATGSHVMARFLGVQFEYNVSLASALESVYSLRASLARYERPEMMTSINADLETDHTLRVVLSWKNGSKLYSMQ